MLFVVEMDYEKKNVWSGEKQDSFILPWFCINGAPNLFSSMAISNWHGPHRKSTTTVSKAFEGGRMQNNATNENRYY